MIRIGILPTIQINEQDNPYNDIYKFSNIISKCVYEAGAIPIGIILNDGKMSLESLKMCDAFIISGGKKIEPFYFDVINYAIKNNVPLLGICLGMQSIGVYSYLESLLKKSNKKLSIENFYKMFENIKKQNVQFLGSVDDHYNEKITRSNYFKNKHKVKINKSSKLYNIYKKEEIDVVSMHKYVINKYGDDIIVNCVFDEVVEGLEYKDGNLFILGVQWHPEFEEKNIILFKSLVDEVKRRQM